MPFIKFILFVCASSDKTFNKAQPAAGVRTYMLHIGTVLDSQKIKKIAVNVFELFPMRHNAKRDL